MQGSIATLYAFDLTNSFISGMRKVTLMVAAYQRLFINGCGWRVDSAGARTSALGQGPASALGKVVWVLPNELHRFGKGFELLSQPWRPQS